MCGCIDEVALLLAIPPLGFEDARGSVARLGDLLQIWRFFVSYVEKIQNKSIKTFSIDYKQ